MKYVDPVNLHEHWPDVRKGLESILQRHPQDWIPEDVYSAVQAGTSTLHLFDEGFVVLTPLKDYGGMTLFIWIAYGQGDVYESWMPQIEDMARKINAKRIRFKSSRKWGKRFDYVTSIYERKL